MDKNSTRQSESDRGKGTEGKKKNGNIQHSGKGKKKESDCSIPVLAIGSKATVASILHNVSEESSSMNSSSMKDPLLVNNHKKKRKRTNKKPVGATTRMLKRPIIANMEKQGFIPKKKEVTTNDHVSAVIKTRSRKMTTKKKQVKPEEVSAAIVEKMILMNEIQETSDVADTLKQMDASVRRTVMQQVHETDVIVASTPKTRDEEITAPWSDVIMTKKMIVNAASSPHLAAFDEISTFSRPAAPDALTIDPVVSIKPTITASVGANLNTVCATPVLPRSVTAKPSSTASDLIMTSPLGDSAFTPQQGAATRLVSTALAEYKVTGDHERQYSMDQVSKIYETDLLQPPTKRIATLSDNADVQLEANGPSEAQSSADGERDGLNQLPNSSRHCAAPQPADTPVPVQEAYESARTDFGEQATPSVNVVLRPFQSGSANHSNQESVNLHCAIAPQAGQLSLNMTPAEPVPEQSTSSAQTQAPSSFYNNFQPSVDQRESGAKAIISTSATAPSKVGGLNLQSMAALLESTVETKEVDIVKDSHKCVQETRSGNLETSSRGESSLTQPVQSMVSLPLCPHNSWGASFGMAFSAQGASSVSRTLSTTPLSSWFLSKGCANFVKQVHFSDNDGADDSSSSEDDVPFTRLLSSSNGADKALQKRKASVTRKNAFLESLTTQTYWRTWYGTVDLHNLLDPPLAHVPDELRSHEVTPLPLWLPSSESDNKRSVKKTNNLERLETDIRQEKQQASAFSKQLLMMLQGKTVSGKRFEDEYSSFLQ
ncbi:unnamed protein product [Peronospora belbahrii]|uniref:Uncharacterized protein n=1 Tax=Peronospora belbahrii TaxID=622444 RepID=A0AAU9L8H9_9STRA|nr:unnamed protein product [Peronospora belbahrii]